jgi:hypothetical protein
VRITPPDDGCRVHIMRHKDRTAWIVKANGGDRVAGLCLLAISRWMNVMWKESSACACCDTVFPDSEFPRAFLVLVPADENPENVKAAVDAVCRYCSKNDDQWLVDQGIHREGLSAAPRRGNDQIH